MSRELSDLIDGLLLTGGADILLMFTVGMLPCQTNI